MKNVKIIFIICSLVLLAACSKKPANSNLNTLPPENSAGQQMINKLALTMSCNTKLLTKAQMLQLDQQATFLLARPKAQVILQSFTPAQGSEDLNLAQAQLRAQAVANYLGIKGVELSRIQIQSYGGAYDTLGANNKVCQVVLLDQSG